MDPTNDLLLDGFPELLLLVFLTFLIPGNLARDPLKPSFLFPNHGENPLFYPFSNETGCSLRILNKRWKGFMDENMTSFSLSLKDEGAPFDWHFHNATRVAKVFPCAVEIRIQYMGPEVDLAQHIDYVILASLRYEVPFLFWLSVLKNWPNVHTLVLQTTPGQRTGLTA
jgi:hypothetical protein